MHFTIKNYENLARSFIYKKNPIYVQYYITARCNLRCEQCSIIYSDARHDEMDIDQINLVAENFKNIGVTFVLLIGGEPFVRKDIHLIVKAFTQRGMHVRLQTNGLATEEQLTKCVENGARDISISLDTLQQSLQDKINGDFIKSWNKAIKSIALVNKIFPENSTAFFNTVLMPKNLGEIKKVLKFATEIGWGMSLVPVHVGELHTPQGYRTMFDTNKVKFKKEEMSKVNELIYDLKALKKDGYNLYDSDIYLDDISNFISQKDLKWRKKNHGICDAIDLYFALAPSGRIKVCCDYEMDEGYYAYSQNFVQNYLSQEISDKAKPKKISCKGCLYGSYPEISISARFLSAMIERLKYFNVMRPEIKKLDYQELIDVAYKIENEQDKCI